MRCVGLGYVRFGYRFYTNESLYDSNSVGYRDPSMLDWNLEMLIIAYNITATFDHSILDGNIALETTLSEIILGYVSCSYFYTNGFFVYWMTSFYSNWYQSPVILLSFFLAL